MAKSVKKKNAKKRKVSVYTCKNCGRVTPFKGAVCQPKVIR